MYKPYHVNILINPVFKRQKKMITQQHVSKENFIFSVTMGIVPLLTTVHQHHCTLRQCVSRTQEVREPKLCLDENSAKALFLSLSTHQH